MPNLRLIRIVPLGNGAAALASLWIDCLGREDCDGVH
jgi:hypothetical protein